MDCIFKKSKYYSGAVADPLKIIQPIGYHFFTDTSIKRTQFKLKEGRLVNKYVSDKTIMKQISSRSIPPRQLDKFLRKSESARKNYYLEGTKQEFITQQLSYSMLIQLRKHYFRKFEDKQLLQFLELIQCLSILNDNMFSIKDYTLSKYFVYYSGTNKRFYDYLQETLREQFIEYDIQIIINEPKLSRPQLRKMQYKTRSELFDYINDVNSIGFEKDKHYSGCHLYISDSLPQIEASDLFSQETMVWKYLFDQITSMMGNLGEGQHAIFRIKGTFSHKTSQILFFLKLCFNRIYLQKSIISNPFNNENYVICQNYHKQHFIFLVDYINNHYDEAISNHQILLIDPNLMFNQDFQNNLKIYNDLSIITKNTTKQLYREFAINSNMDIYPNKQELLTKLSQLKIKNIEKYIEEIKLALPDLQDVKKEKKEEEIIEKAAIPFDFDFYDSIANQNNKKKEMNIFDISKQKSQKPEIEDYMATGQKLMKKNKEKPKKKKAQKNEEY